MSPTMLALILVAVTMSACAQLALKLGMKGPGVTAGLAEGGMTAAISVALNPWVLLGLSIYGLSVVLWLWVLSKVELSVAYPFVGVSFLITMAFGAWLLHEEITFGRLIGTVLIAIGCVLVARSA
jgi:drug/metabolite transporter (DMT)-like permease